MDEYKVYPRRVRGLGNVLNKLDRDDFELFKSEVKRGDGKVLQEGVELGVFKMQLVLKEVIITVTGETSYAPNESTTLTFTLTTKDTGEPVPNVDLFVFENNLSWGNVETNDEGKATFTYSSTLQGLHVLEITSNNQNGFNGVHKTLNVYCYKDSGVTLSASPNTAYINDHVVLTATLKNTTDNEVLSGRTITFYNGDEIIGTAITNDEGEATFVYEPE